MSKLMAWGWGAIGFVTLDCLYLDRGSFRVYDSWNTSETQYNKLMAQMLAVSGHRDKNCCLVVSYKTRRCVLLNKLRLGHQRVQYTQAEKATFASESSFLLQLLL
jgi:hypothetical protein